MAFRRHALTFALVVALAASVLLVADARKNGAASTDASGGKFNGTRHANLNGTHPGSFNGTRGNKPHKNGTGGPPGGAGSKKGGKKGPGGRGRGPMRGANFTGSVAAVLRGVNMVGSAGAANSSGHVNIVVVKTATDVDIHFSVAVDRTLTPGLPTSASIRTGSATTNGETVLVFPSTPTWRNTTRGGRKPRRNGGTASTDASRPVHYSYMFKGVWANASSITAASGDSVAAVVASLVQSPGDYYAVVMTEAFPEGAMRGQFKNHTRKY
eukprot:TRINITY_DN358_c0_g1_i1.p1 TRINITY_DN358_c0_g1~~TRINITY_DN358_c0_g1_i1.p1  ORF type:complete len:269 (+),score=-12.51 TRINITY_DN358_c0_g1_i1:164-970(+)